MNDLLRYVDGKEVPCPSTFDWSLNDISDSDAGRTHDANSTMYVNRIGQKRKITLGWQNKDPETTAQILKMFNPEYIRVTYWDAMDGCEETRTFYCSAERTAPVRSWYVGKKRYSLISFSIIER